MYLNTGNGAFSPPIQTAEEFLSSEGGLVVQAYVDAINYYVPNSLEIEFLPKTGLMERRQCGVRVVDRQSGQELIRVTQASLEGLYCVSGTYYESVYDQDGYFFNGVLGPYNDSVMATSAQCAFSELGSRVGRSLYTTLPSSLRAEYDALNGSSLDSYDLS